MAINTTNLSISKQVRQRRDLSSFTGPAAAPANQNESNQVPLAPVPRSQFLNKLAFKGYKDKIYMSTSANSLEAVQEKYPDHVIVQGRDWCDSYDSYKGKIVKIYVEGSLEDAKFPCEAILPGDDSQYSGNYFNYYLIKPPKFTDEQERSSWLKQVAKKARQRSSNLTLVSTEESD